jgi:hypothetical protein
MLQLQSQWMPFVLLSAAFCCNLYAVDGVILIDQNHAMMGGITPGDAPGFPVTISQSGSYRLSGNLTVTPNLTGIEITADNVTIDLGGFSITGPVDCPGNPSACISPGGSPPTGYGVLSLNNNIRVVNGTVRGMGNAGVYLSGISGFVKKVFAESNGETGILVSYGVVVGSSARINGEFGIYIDGSGTVSRSNAVGNGFIGLRIACPSVVIGSSASLNGSADSHAFGESHCGLTGNAPEILQASKF